MQVTKNITLDLLETGSPVIIKAKQNDRNTRYIAAHLYVGRLDYQVPSGTEIAFRYKKPDGTAGFYDALPDNSPAITVSGNTVTVELVEQVLTVAGCVHCEINMYNAASEKLTTFTFEISVEESVLTDTEIISSDYYNVLTAEIAKALQAVTDATEQAENAAQSAQDAADSAAMSKDWAAGQPVTYSGTPVSIAYAGAQRIAAITAYGETPQGGTTEAPVALTGVDSVQVCGNNLLPKATETKTLNGVTFTPNPDGSVSVSGTATNNAAYVFADGLDKSLLGQTVCLSAGSMQAQLVINEKKPTGEWIRNVLVSAHTPSAAGVLSKQAEANILYATIYVPTGTTVNTTVYPMLNLGESPLPYEPYQGSVTQLPIPRPLRRVGDVKDKCVTRQDYESAEKLVVTYNLGFVELDGTETSHLYAGIFYLDYSAAWPTPANRVNGVCSHYPYGPYSKGKIGLTDNGAAVVYNPNGDYTGDEGGLANWKAYLAAQKEAGTPVQVAYQLATPETYATDPLDIDNAAGPLTVLTGGELEVRMTELVGMRSDVSNNTVAFTETAQDADIASGEKLSVLFGKIKKRFSAMLAAIADRYTKTEAEARFMPNPNLLDNSDFTNPVNQRGSTSYSGGGTYCIDRWDIASTATVAVVSDGIKITATTLSGIRQKIENITDGQLLVFQLCDNADTVYTQAFAPSTTQAEYTTDFGKFRFVLNSGGVLTISILLNAGERTFKWAKLEKGSVATPYVPKGYGAELSECLRFYYQVASVRTFGQQHTGAGTYVNIILPQVMRVTPTVSAPGEWTIRFNGMDKKATVSSVNSLTGNTLNLTMSTIAGETYIGPLYAFYDGKITFSADL